jgi:4-alpha-glucanotransferase
VNGEGLADHALFEALSLHMNSQGFGAGWHNWPEPYQNRSNEAVKAFAVQHEDEISFQAWLQWLSDHQLGEAQRRACDAGMRVGLYLDFAVGDSPDGSSAWSDPDLTVVGAHIGAPPDDFNLDGQNWGLAPLSPLLLAARHFVPLRRTLEQVLRHAGALRIDHAMALQRLYLVPAGHSAREGAYVRYPRSGLLAVLAEVSHAQQAIIIGEDLGTVPRGFRSVMRRAEIQSYRLLYFERSDGQLRLPRDYPHAALACVSTHDLPPLLGWWHGDDIELRAHLALVTEDIARAQHAERDRDRRDLLSQLIGEELLTRKETERAAESRLATDTARMLCVAVHRHLARAPSRLLAVRLEDLAGQQDAVNVPGVSVGYPNWRLKLPMEIEQLVSTSLFNETCHAVAAERPWAP